MSLTLRPASFGEVKGFVEDKHRHNPHLAGGFVFRWGVAVEDDSGSIVAVGAAARPVARLLDDGLTLEVTRVCTDGTPHACSMIYGSFRRMAKALGYKRIQTYTLESEPGTSLRAAGWHIAATGCGGTTWAKRKDRPGRHEHDIAEKKVRWEAPIA